MLLTPLIIGCGGAVDDPVSVGDGSLGTLLDFSLPDQHGDEVALSALAGTPTVVDVGAVWCLPCQETAVTLQDLANDLWLQRRIQVVTVLVEDLNTQPPTVEVSAAWASEFRLSLPVLADVRQQHRDRWSLSGWPTTLVVDSKGMVVARNDGLVHEDVLRAQALDAR